MGYAIFRDLTQSQISASPLLPCALVAPKLCEDASSRRLSAHALNHLPSALASPSKFTVKVSTKFHDRFLIIDKSTLIHVGASLNHLGKKCFRRR